MERQHERESAIQGILHSCDQIREKKKLELDLASPSTSTVALAMHTMKPNPVRCHT